MTPISSVCNSSTACPTQGNVIPTQMPTGKPPSDSVSFCGKHHHNDNGTKAWATATVLGGLAVLGIAFRKNISAFVQTFKPSSLNDAINTLLAKATNNKTCTSKDALEYLKNSLSGSKNANNGFIWRMSNEMKAQFNIVKKEAIILGHKTKDGVIRISKITLSDNLDKKLLNMINKGQNNIVNVKFEKAK